MTVAADQGHVSYSKAFENFVKDEDDLEGLLGYALFKESIRQDIKRGARQEGSRRDPSPATVTAFREQASNKLQDFAVGAIDEQRDALVEQCREAMLAEIEPMMSERTGELRTYVGQRTNVWTAAWVSFGASMVAWMLTLAVTVLILLARGGDLVAEAVSRVDQQSREQTMQSDGSQQ